MISTIPFFLCKFEIKDRSLEKQSESLTGFIFVLTSFLNMCRKEATLAEFEKSLLICRY